MPMHRLTIRLRRLTMPMHRLTMRLYRPAMPMHHFTMRLCCLTMPLHRLTMRLCRLTMPMHCHLLKLSCVKYICAPTVSRRILHPNEMRYSLATFLPTAPFAQPSPQLN